MTVIETTGPESTPRIRNLKKMQLVLAGICAMAACHQSPMSHNKDIATDLFESKSYYFYGEGTDIVRATCDADKPALKEFCTTDIVKINETTLKDSFVLELQRQAKINSDAVQPLEAQYATVDQNFTVSSTKLAALTSELNALQSSLQIIQTEQNAFEATNASIISAYDREIARTKQALSANPSDAGLQRALAALEAEVNPLNAKRLELQTKVAELTSSSGKIPVKSQEIANENATNSNIKRELDGIAIKLKKTRENQIRVLSQLNAIDDTLVRIRQGVRYATMKADAQLPEHQQILALFNPMFTKRLEEIKAQTTGVVKNDLVRIADKGFLQLQSNGEWRGVCDDNFDQNALLVACRMLGKKPGSFSVVAGSSGSFWLDDIQCTGNEKSLFDCKHAGLGNENCDANETIAIKCVD